MDSMDFMALICGCYGISNGNSLGRLEAEGSRRRRAAVVQIPYELHAVITVVTHNGAYPSDLYGVGYAH